MNGDRNAGTASRVSVLAHRAVDVYTLGDTDRRPPGNIIDLLQQFADGIIVILPFESDYLALLAGAQIPIVTIDQGDDLPFPTVAASNYQGARMAIQHLADLGHGRIGFIGGNECLASARERLKAFVDMQQQLGLDCDPDLISHGDFMQKGGFGAANRLIDREKPPTAIFAANDVSAAGALVALRVAGRKVPEDISVIGFDDISLASQLYPTLSTVRQPLPQMARAAVNMLLAMIVGLEAPSQRITLPAQFITRQSTAALELRNPDQTGRGREKLSLSISIDAQETGVGETRFGRLHALRCVPLFATFSMRQRHLPMRLDRQRPGQAQKDYRQTRSSVITLWPWCHSFTVLVKQLR